jgi:hypothetical protein
VSNPGPDFQINGLQHYLPDIRTEHPLWIFRHLSMNMNHQNTQQGSAADDTLPKPIKPDMMASNGMLIEIPFCLCN